MKVQRAGSERLGLAPARHSREAGAEAEPVYLEIRVGGHLDDHWAA